MSNRFSSGLGDGAGRMFRSLIKKRLFWVISLAFLGIVISINACTTYVPPNTVGIRQVYYGGGAGIKKEMYGPGTHFTMAGYERLHLFPSDLLAVNFSDSTSEMSDRSRNVQAIKVQTSDGYNVVIDVTILYRIKDPYLVFNEAGPGHAYEDKLVVPNADRILRITLGSLNSEEFYQGPRRIEKAHLAQEQLRGELDTRGILVDRVLIRRYVYDERYQQVIEARTLKDQQALLSQAETKAATEQGKRDEIVAEGKARMDTILAEGAGKVQKLRAEADLYTRTQSAEGRKLVAVAEAQGTAMESKAMQGAGSENLVGLKLAETLKGVKVLVLPSDGKNGMNPLDTASMLRKFEVGP
jgi:regulator of protease activity HflC (stomatin/prohibitin superfamily)